MQYKLKGLEKLKAIIAIWIFRNLVMKLSPVVGLKLCIETSNIYAEYIEAQEDE